MPVKGYYHNGRKSDLLIIVCPVEMTYVIIRDLSPLGTLSDSSFSEDILNTWLPI